jgi:hypothetical protein
VVHRGCIGGYTSKGTPLNARETGMVVSQHRHCLGRQSVLCSSLRIAM